MRRILIFAGTTEGRELSERLCENREEHWVSVATEYGVQVLKEDCHAHVVKGRMDVKQMQDFAKEKGITLVVDATHPYATEVSENIQAALQNTGILLWRLQRELPERTGENIHYFSDHEECAQALSKVSGAVFLTTGSKNLSSYVRDAKLQKRLVVRVLPGMESMALCEQAGLQGKQIVAMQGPFSTEMDVALMRQFQIRVLVTKQSGKNGGFFEKLEAAKQLQIPVFVIGAPKETRGMSIDEICRKLQMGPVFKGEKKEKKGMTITLAGCGMGGERTCTEEVKEAIRQADILLGAPRLIAPYTPRMEKQPYYLSQDIIPYLNRWRKESKESLKVVILFSGDTGFYSGCKKLSHAIKKIIDEEQWEANLLLLPGISTPAYLAAAIMESWEDAKIVSVHGKGEAKEWMESVLGTIAREEKTFLLFSGAEDVAALGEALKKPLFSHCTFFVGYNLSAEDEKIFPYSSVSLKGLPKGLYCGMVKNEAVRKTRLLGKRDTDFLRDKVPMTKEEVRYISVGKLGLHEESVVYDVGSGTGSVAMEMAGLSPRITVYAIERKQEAVALIEKNKQHLGIENVVVKRGEAPEVFGGLPQPTHAFIGGSGGKLHAILEHLYEKNPKLCVVVNGVSLETIQEMKQIEQKFLVKDFEMVQVLTTRIQQVGEHSMMKGGNPIWICSFQFKKREEG